MVSSLIEDFIDESQGKVEMVEKIRVSKGKDGKVNKSVY